MRFLCLLGIVLLTSIAGAETVVLTDGTRVEGRLKKTTDGWDVTQANGVVVHVTENRVASIQAGEMPKAEASRAMDRLDSLRRAVDHMSSISQIMDRYQNFIDNNTDSEALAAAREDMDLWRKRLEQKLVKVGDAWVTQEERDRRRQAAGSVVDSAHDLINQNRTIEATQLLKQALTDDPTNVGALYLQGVLLYNQEQVSQARKNFEAANELLPNYAPILNNLGVISWRQKSFVAAMGFYDQAMTAAPGSRQILDNVVEALHAIPDDNKQAPVVKRGMAMFQEQDAILQQEMAKSGWYRWGSSWVDSKQLDELKATQAKIQQQLDDLSAKFDGAQEQIGKIDSEIDQNQREMHRLQASNTYVDQNGAMITLLPQSYYDLQSDIDKLNKDRGRLQDLQQRLREQARQVQQSSPVPQFTGLQHIFGVAAVPQLVAEVPAPVPSTQP